VRPAGRAFAACSRTLARNLLQLLLTEVSPWRSTASSNFAPSTASASRNCKLQNESLADRSPECWLQGAERDHRGAYAPPCSSTFASATASAQIGAGRKRLNRLCPNHNMLEVRSATTSSQLVWIGLKLSRNPPPEVSQKRLTSTDAVLVPRRGSP
jgi:hypothetical protein